MPMAFKESRISAGPRLEAQSMVRWPADIISEAEFRDPKMNWVKALLLLSCLTVQCADLVTTNAASSNHGGSELNPFMRLAQTWLGAWWLVPKLSFTFVVMWLLSRSKNLYNVSLVVALCSTPVLNNLIIIAGMK